MNDVVTEGVPTPTAATRQTEPAVVAAISGTLSLWTSAAQVKIYPARSYPV
jgi:hypothetical protein